MAHNHNHLFVCVYRSVSQLIFGWYSLSSAGSCRLLSARLGSSLWVRFQSLIFWEGPKELGLSFRGCVLMAGHQGAGTKPHKPQKDAALHHNFSIQEMLAKDTCPTM